MEIISTVPIWAKIYWAVLFIFYAGGNYYEWKVEERKIWVISLDTLSIFFISIFLIDFFHDKNKSIIGYWIIPIVVSGIIWELFIANYEIKRHEQNPDPELSEFANKACNYFGLFMSNMIVVPGYFLGLLLSYNELLNLV